MQSSLPIALRSFAEEQTKVDENGRRWTMFHRPPSSYRPFSSDWGADALGRDFRQLEATEAGIETENVMVCHKDLL